MSKALDTQTRKNVVRSITVQFVRHSHGNNLYEAQWGGPNPGVGFPTWNDQEECRAKAQAYIMNRLEV